jgi:hypothetical protein
MKKCYISIHIYQSYINIYLILAAYISKFIALNYKFLTKYLVFNSDNYQGEKYNI